MKTLISLLVCVAVAHAGIISYNDKSLWEQFKHQHKKVYSNSQEHEFRFKIFLDNLRKIAEHNRDYEAGTSSFRMGINQFTDLLPSEFAEKYLVRPKEVKDSVVERQALPIRDDLPESVDWRQKGAVTGVKDQGQCGGCWAFAATGAMEGACFQANGKLVSLSEQNLIDCSDRSYGNYGCGGGLEYNGWDYVIDVHGLDTEEAYPYQARNGQCHFDSSKVGCTISSYKHLPKNDEAQLKNAVATVGPIAIGIDASYKFQMYAGGVFDDNTCSSYQLNHSVLAVGYGVENGREYFLVKNSWGSSFGEDGYIKMARNQNNQCGVAADASYPIV